MHYFHYKGRDLFCEEVPLRMLADRFGTPLYVYSFRTLVEHFEKLKKAFSPLKPLICYSVKANSNLSILKILVKRGAGLDIVSGGELFRAEKAACPYKKIVYASVGKTGSEIKQALKAGILMFNVESLPELQRINDIASGLGKKAAACLRVNPDVDPKTHKYITTGKKEAKFGISLKSAAAIIYNRPDFPFVEIKGIHIHIGSQITKVGPYVKAIGKVLKFIGQLRKRGVSLEYLNIGGGFGIVYGYSRAGKGYCRQCRGFIGESFICQGICG